VTGKPEVKCCYQAITLIDAMMSAMVIYPQLTIMPPSLSHAGEQISSHDKYVRVDAVAHELKAASGFSSCECFHSLTLIKCALIGNPEESATGRSAHEDFCAGEIM